MIIYCQVCASRLTKETDTVYRCPQGHAFYNNPKATVAVVLAKDGRVLFSKRGIDPNKGMYDLPGGFLDFGENPFEAAKREMQEETGVEVDDLEIIAAYGLPYLEDQTVCDIIVFANAWKGTLTPLDDCAGLEWNDPSFIDSEVFAPKYPGLSALLAARI